MYKAEDIHSSALQNLMIEEENKKLRYENRHLKNYIKVLESEIFILKHGG